MPLSFIKGMKKKITLIVILFLYIQSLKAQEKELLVGIKITPELTFRNSSIKALKSDPKVSLGGSLQIIKSLNRTVSLESGLSFVNRGWQWDVTITDEYGDPLKKEIFRYNYNYLGIPVLIRLNIKSFYLSAGPSLVFSIFYYERPNIAGLILRDVKTVNLSFPISVGYKKRINDKVSAYMEIRYNPLLNDVYTKSSGKQIYQNLGLGLGATYKLK